MEEDTYAVEAGLLGRGLGTGSATLHEQNTSDVPPLLILTHCTC